MKGSVGEFEEVMGRIEGARDVLIDVVFGKVEDLLALDNASVVDNHRRVTNLGVDGKGPVSIAVAMIQGERTDLFSDPLCARVDLGLFGHVASVPRDVVHCQHR